MKDKWIEKKIKPRLWQYKYTEILYKRPKVLKGKIKGIQRAIKTGTNTYSLILKGKRRRYYGKYY